MLFKCFTIALREFPWATMIMFLPLLIVGTIVSFQKGRTLSMVSFKLYISAIDYLCSWQECWINILVSSVEFGVSLIILIKFWWWDIEASSPDLYLFLTVFFYGFHLVKSLESSIVSLIESPWLDDRNVMTIQLISSIVECLNSTSEDRSVTYVELEPILSENFASLDGLLDTLFIMKNYH